MVTSTDFIVAGVRGGWNGANIKMMANDQVTRQEFEELRETMKNGFAAVDKRFDGMDAKFESRLAEMEARLTEKMRDMQTELLRAFMPWQESIHTHMRELEVNTNNSVQSMRTRLGALEDRMLQVERKLLGPH